MDNKFVVDLVGSPRVIPGVIWAAYVVGCCRPRPTPSPNEFSGSVSGAGPVCATVPGEFNLNGACISPRMTSIEPDLYALDGGSIGDGKTVVVIFMFLTVICQCRVATVIIGVLGVGEISNWQSANSAGP